MACCPMVPTVNYGDPLRETRVTRRPPKETRNGHLSLQIFLMVLAGGVRSVIATRDLEVALLGLEELLWIP